jgi:hypothetical protein
MLATVTLAGAALGEELVEELRPPPLVFRLRGPSAGFSHPQATVVPQRTGSVTRPVTGSIAAATQRRAARPQRVTSAETALPAQRRASRNLQPAFASATAPAQKPSTWPAPIAGAHVPASAHRPAVSTARPPPVASDVVPAQQPAKDSSSLATVLQMALPAVWAASPPVAQLELCLAELPPVLVARANAAFAVAQHKADIHTRFAAFSSQLNLQLSEAAAVLGGNLAQCPVDSRLTVVAACQHLFVLLGEPTPLRPISQPSAQAARESDMAPPSARAPGRLPPAAAAQPVVLAGSAHAPAELGIAVASAAAASYPVSDTIRGRASVPHAEGAPQAAPAAAAVPPAVSDSAAAAGFTPGPAKEGRAPHDLQVLAHAPPSQAPLQHGGAPAQVCSSRLLEGGRCAPRPWRGRCFMRSLNSAVTHSECIQCPAQGSYAALCPIPYAPYTLLTPRSRPRPM